MSEPVNHPSHYGGKDNPYEAIKVIEAWGLDFCLGNSIKYISRAGKKGDDKTVEDLEKAKWYIERRIQQLSSVSMIKVDDGFDIEKWRGKRVRHGTVEGIFLYSIVDADRGRFGLVEFVAMNEKYTAEIDIKLLTLI